MSIRIALGQINPTVGDLVGNTKKIVSFIKKAKGKKVDIVVFPELAICGYPPEDLLLKKHFVDDNLFFLKSIVKETLNITAIVGFVDRDKKNNIYSAAAVINNKKLKGVYHKMEFPGYSAFDEKRYFTHGKNNQIFSIAGIDFGITTKFPHGLPENIGTMFFNVSPEFNVNVKETSQCVYAGERYFAISIKKD